MWVPPAVRVSADNGPPTRQVAKLGDASNALSAIANAIRSSGLKNLSSGNTPTFRKGGSTRRSTRVSRSRLSPSDQACSKMWLITT